MNAVKNLLQLVKERKTGSKTFGKWKNRCQIQCRHFRLYLNKMGEKFRTSMAQYRYLGQKMPAEMGSDKGKE